MLSKFETSALPPQGARNCPCIPEYLGGNYPVQEGSEIRYVWRKHPGVQITPALWARNEAPYCAFFKLSQMVAA